MPIRNKKGQIAIFVVLIFPALFVLFAMSLNVALVVHDKVNFQNSLDLAAYYGAKQQAEVLNAMAHINYQMRQNWKLLAWRYRILGTLTQDWGHPSSQPPSPDYWCPQNDRYPRLPRRTIHCTSPSPSCPPSSACQNACSQAQSLLSGSYGGNYCDINYFVCVSHGSWIRGLNHSKQNLCEKVDVNIPAVQPMFAGSLGGPLLMGMSALWGSANASTTALQNEISDSCPREGTINWLMAQFFLTHFRLDQKDRKVMMRKIYDLSLKQGKDLDGKSIFEGAKKVFKNNLSRANLNNVRHHPDNYLEELNPLKDLEFEKVFGILNAWPVLQYVHFDGNDLGSNTACAASVRPHYYIEGGNYNTHWAHIKARLSANSRLHAVYNLLQNPQEVLFSLNHLDNSGGLAGRTEDLSKPLDSLTLGFYKKKKIVIYYGLRGSFLYLPENQIFSLRIRDIPFKASSFAKAFGGRFGPPPEQSDPLIPLHHYPPEDQPKVDIPTLNSALLQPNYSRWPGDRWGLINRILHDPFITPSLSFLRKQSNYPFQRVYNIGAFFHLIFHADDFSDDPLARPDTGNTLKTTFMRMMELMAVYPDLYDLSYYSISSNYMRSYFPRGLQALVKWK